MNIEALISALRTDEGLRLKPYMDTAIPPRITIGYGRNLSDRGISVGEAGDMLYRDAIEAQRIAAALVPNWLRVDDVRQNVVANMAFNLGAGGLKKFQNFLAAVNDGRYAEAADHMKDSAWYGQVKGRAQRLAEEMRTGVVV